MKKFQKHGLKIYAEILQKVTLILDHLVYIQVHLFSQVFQCRIKYIFG